MTIQQQWPSKRRTQNIFLCLVKRSEVFNVFFQPERWELWNVLADTHQQAMAAAKYHFYRSKEKEILVTTTPISK